MTDTKKCRPLSVRVSIKRNDTDKLEFKLTRACNEEDKAIYKIFFAFLKKQADGTYDAKIELEIDINKTAPSKKENANKTVNAGLSQRQVDVVRTKVARRADAVLEEKGTKKLLSSMDLESLDFGTPNDSTEKVFEALDQIAEEESRRMKRLRKSLIHVLDLQ